MEKGTAMEKKRITMGHGDHNGGKGGPKKVLRTQQIPRLPSKDHCVVEHPRHLLHRFCHLTEDLLKELNDDFVSCLSEFQLILFKSQ